MEKWEVTEEVWVLLRLLDFVGRRWQSLGLVPQALSWQPSPGLPCGAGESRPVCGQPPVCVSLAASASAPGLSYYWV